MSDRGRKLADIRWSKNNALHSALPDAEQTAVPTGMPLTLSPNAHHENLSSDSSEDHLEPLVSKLLDEIRDRDEVTDRFILAIAAQASEAGLAHTLEALKRRRRRQPALTSESKYARATLVDYVRNGGKRQEQAA